MIFELSTADGRHIKTFHNLAQASQFISYKIGVRGFSIRTLRKYTFNEGEDYIYNGYRLLAKDAEYNKTTIAPQLKKAKVLQGVKRIDADRNVNTINITVKRNKFVLDYTTLPNLLIYVQSQVDNIIPNKEDKFISVAITYNTGGYEFTISTVYSDYNNYQYKLRELIEKLFREYDDDMRLLSVEIKYYALQANEDIVIYKQQAVENYKNKYDILFDLKDRNIKIDLYNEIKEYKYIVSPHTYKLCLLSAILMGVLNYEDVSKEVSKINKCKWLNDLTHTIKDIKIYQEYIIKKYKKEINIIIYFIGGKQEKIFFNKYNNGVNISLLINAGHSYYLHNDNTFIFKDIEQHKESDINRALIIKKVPKKKKLVELMTRIYTYDMETVSDDNGITSPYAIGVHAYENDDMKAIKKIGNESNKDYDIRRGLYYEFYKTNETHDIIEDFIKYINNLKSYVIFYAHNGGKFDCIILMSSILKNFNITQYLDSNGRIINLEFYNKIGCKICFRDSYNFISQSLSSACESFKLSISKMTDAVKHDLINISNCYKESNKLIEDKTIYDYTSDYLYYDCASLKDLLRLYNIAINKSCNFNLYDNMTNAGIARNVYLNKYYDEHKTPIYYIRKDIDHELREYYYGGRNEIFNKLGATNKKLYYMDFTSMYPYKMRDGIYPYGKMNIIEGDNLQYDPEWFGFVKVLLKHKHKKYKPYHPIKHNEKLVFGYINDYKELIITTEELKYSLDNDLGYDYKYIKVYNYKNKTTLFNKVITDMFKLKSEAEKKENESLRATAKTILNSLYGFWGLNYYKRDKNIIKDNRIEENQNKGSEYINNKIEKNKNNIFNSFLTDNKLKNVVDIGDHTLYQIEGEITPNCANVGIAFMVSAYARTELYNLMFDIEKIGGTVYYCDTDSVITDIDIPKNKSLHDKYIKTNTALLGELTNEATKIYTKLLKNDKIDNKEIIKFIKKQTPYFTELITIANKFYYLKINFIYNGKEYNASIKKGKGIDLKARYNNKIIDNKNKIIEYKNKSIDGKYTFERDDYLYLVDDYIIKCDTLTFSSNFNNSIMLQHGLIKMNIDKTITKLYDKGDYNILDGSIKTMVIYD